MSKSFGEHLRDWRVKARLSQIHLESIIKKKRGFICNVEKGITKPPNKVLCEAIAAALGRDPITVWAVAAPERLRELDADVYKGLLSGELSLPGANPSVGGAIAAILLRSNELLDAARELREAAATLTTEALGLREQTTALTMLLETELLAVYPPVCPKCGTKMHLKQNRENQHYFWGCPRWNKQPPCKGALDYTTWHASSAQKLIEMADHG